MAVVMGSQNLAKMAMVGTVVGGRRHDYHQKLARNTVEPKVIS